MRIIASLVALPMLLAGCMQDLGATGDVLARDAEWGAGVCESNNAGECMRPQDQLIPTTPIR